jgi:hypothetical protein
MSDTFRSGTKRVIHTRANTSFDQWREMVLEEYEKLGVDPASVRPLRELHAWEGGDTTQGWATHVWHNNKLRERTKEINMLNGKKTG